MGSETGAGHEDEHIGEARDLARTAHSLRHVIYLDSLLRFRAAEMLARCPAGGCMITKRDAEERPLPLSLDLWRDNSQGDKQAPGRWQDSLCEESPLCFLDNS